MQAFFQKSFYNQDMTQTISKLKELRERAGLSQRELARVIEQDSSNVSYWERTGKLPRSEVLLPIAKALGVSVEELLGEQKPRKPSSKGRLSTVFDRVGQLPRRQQLKVIEMAEGFLALHENQ
jgi:transcriptional regulator with XRE-family HTH domain